MQVKAKKEVPRPSKAPFEIEDSASVRYLQEELVRVTSEKPMQSREVQAYTLNFLSCHHHFNRLVTKIGKGIEEHKEFVEFLEGQIKQGDFPT